MWGGATVRSGRLVQGRTVVRRSAAAAACGVIQLCWWPINARCAQPPLLSSPTWANLQVPRLQAAPQPSTPTTTPIGLRSAAQRRPIPSGSGSGGATSPQLRAAPSWLPILVLSRFTIIALAHHGTIKHHAASPGSSAALPRHGWRAGRPAHRAPNPRRCAPLPPPCPPLPASDPSLATIPFIYSPTAH